MMETSNFMKSYASMALLKLTNVVNCPRILIASLIIKVDVTMMKMIKFVSITLNRCKLFHILHCEVPSSVYDS